MKKNYLAAILLAIGMPVAAQDTYESAKLFGSDLNGTARYVGMGGAMEALGADISTISTNPAGIGLFRHSTVSASMGLINQQDATKFDGRGKTNVSFDQAGFVYSTESGQNSYVNVGFNYHKSRNFNQLLSAANSLYQAGLNKLAYSKYIKDGVAYGGYNLDWNRDNELMGYESPAQDAYRANTYSQWDYLYMNAFNAETGGDNNTTIYFNDADAYSFDRAHRGWINEYDFNLSGSLGGRVYLGLTVGIYDVNYKHYSEFTEGFTSRDGIDAGVTTLADDRTMSGTGYDVKVGIIFRPVEFSPFRVGLSVQSPTWYDLRTENSTVFFNNSMYGDFDQGVSSETYEFHLRTPWKFGLSLGHTVGNYLALGAGYEFADYSSSDVRINNGASTSYSDSYVDRVMSDHIERSLRGVSTVKVGAEVKASPEVAIRAGYNYVSPMYEKNAVRNTQLDSPGVLYSSTADYVNWKDTHRLTTGLGFKVAGWNFDLAYQYSTTNGDFYPFQPDAAFRSEESYETNVSTPTKVSNKRHQLLFTVGYTF